MEPEPFGEVLGDEPTEPLSERVWRWLRARPLVLALVVVVALAIGAPLLVHLVRGPRLPVLSVSDDGAPPSAPPWQLGVDGRPSGPVVLSVVARVRRTSAAAGSTTVVGIDGPGVLQADNPAAVLAGVTSTMVPLRAVLDCSALPATVPAGAYGLRVQVRANSRLSTGVVPAGAPGARWRDMIALACGAWSARRDVTVTALTARVHPTPTVSKTDLQLTLSNSGKLPVRVSALPSTGDGMRVLGRLPFTVPARGLTRAAVVLEGCDVMGDAAAEIDPATGEVVVAESSSINLVALAGSVPVPAGAAIESDGGGGLQPSTIVLAPAARSALNTALAQACGQIEPPLPVLHTHSVQFDPDTDRVSIALEIDVEPDQRVSWLELRSVPVASTEKNAYRPVWTSLKHLVPDRTGQVRVTLRYRTPVSGACPDYGGYLPGFVASARVPVSRGVRYPSYDESLDLSSDPAAVPLLCGGAQGADDQAHSAATRSGG